MLKRNTFRHRTGPSGTVGIEFQDRHLEPLRHLSYGRTDRGTEYGAGSIISYKLLIFNGVVAEGVGSVTPLSRA
jgi:hypothetical protein